MTAHPAARTPVWERPDAPPERPCRPACMGADEYARWREANTALHRGVDRAVSPCQDCIPAFAVEMQAEGRCDGVPAIGPPAQTVSPATHTTARSYGGL